jgi:hypothetical protein
MPYHDQEPTALAKSGYTEARNAGKSIDDGRCGEVVRYEV